MAVVWAVNTPLLETLSDRALAIAAAAVANGNHPFGALVAREDGTILLEAENTVNTDADPSCHAETNLVKKMAAAGFFKRGAETSAGAVPVAELIFVASTEPCMMCSAALYWSGVRRVVYAGSEAGLAKHAGDDFLCPCVDVFSRGNHRVDVVGPVREEAGCDLHGTYWPNL